MSEQRPSTPWPSQVRTPHASHQICSSPFSPCSGLCRFSDAQSILHLVDAWRDLVLNHSLGVLCLARDSPWLNPPQLQKTPHLPLGNGTGPGFTPCVRPAPAQPAVSE